MRLVRHQQGIALTWAALITPVIVLFLVLMVDLMRWWVYAHELQNAVDAAALAGGQELYIEQWVDAAGTVYFARVFINHERAVERALYVLNENLQRMNPGPRRFRIVRQEVEVIAPDPMEPDYLLVRARAGIQLDSILAGSLGIMPGELSRSADAKPECEGPGCRWEPSSP